ncbi:hypothetical protein ACI65C_001598 [Semiaphis heraclei]
MVELFIVHCSMLSSILIMGGCTAPNCSSFPREKIRKDKWVQNCRRDKWIPTAHSELCENDEIARLQMENTNLKNQIEEKDATSRKFLNDDQIAATIKTPREWSTETIIKGLKLRFALGVHGYKYLSFVTTSLGM